jgi:hypothetical protein
MNMYIQTSTQSVSLSSASTNDVAPVPPSTPPLLPVAVLACSGDPGAMLTALTVMSSKTDRDIARTQRNEALVAEAAAESATLADMHDKADLQRAEGFVDGGMQLAQGASDVFAGLCEAGGNKLGATWGKGVSASLAAGKSVSDGLFGGAITDKDASVKEHEIAAQQFKQIAEDAHDGERDVAAQIAKAIDFYKEYSETKSQTLLAAIHAT